MWTFRQSTAGQEVPLGKFVDEADGVTAETALTIANTDIKLQKTGGTTLVSKNSGGATHISGGRYYAVLDATDTDTIGPMKITVDVAGVLPVEVWCEVLDEAVFDVKYGTTAPSTLGATPAVNVTQWSGSAVSTPDTAGVPEVNVIEWRGTLPNTLVAGNVRADLDSITTQPVTCANPVTILASVGTAATSTAQTGDGYAIVNSGTHGNAALKTLIDTVDTVVDAVKVKTDQLTFTVTNRVDATSTLGAGDSPVLQSGTATAGAATTITIQTAVGADDRPIGCLIKITGGTGVGQCRSITDYVNSTQVVTVDRPWTTNPDNTSVYSILYDNSAVETVCKIGAAFTSTAGTEVRCSAWLERNGQTVTTYAASASCTLTFREHGSGTDLFSVTDSAVNAQGIFEVTQASPAFASDRLYIASAAITEGGNVFTSRQPVPVR